MPRVAVRAPLALPTPCPQPRPVTTNVGCVVTAPAWVRAQAEQAAFGVSACPAREAAEPTAARSAAARASVARRTCTGKARLSVPATASIRPAFARPRAYHAPVRLLVTGAAAGFIGSNFVRYWVERHPGDRVVASTCSPTPATAPTSSDLDGPDHVRPGRHRRPAELRGDVLREHAIDVVVNFAAESHNIVRDRGPGRCSSARTCSARRRCARRPGGSGVARFHHISTCEVYGDLALDSRRDVHRGVAVPAAHAVQRLEGRRPTTRCARTHETFGLPITITNCANNYGPYQFPEKVVPLFTTRALDDQPLPLYASTREPARMDPRARPLPPRSSWSCNGAATARRTTSARASNAASRRSPTAVLDDAGQAGVAEDDRARPARATTADTCSTRRRWHASSDGRRRSPSTGGSPRRSPGTRSTATGGPAPGAPPRRRDGLALGAACGAAFRRCGACSQGRLHRPVERAGRDGAAA